LDREEKVKRIILVVFTVLLVSAIIFGGCAKEEAPTTPTTPTTPTAPEVKPIEWRFCSFIPPFDCFALDEIQWAKDLEEATGGRMKIVNYYSESLVKMAGLFDAVASGTADMGQVSTSPYPERFKLNFIAYLPMVFDDPSQTGQSLIALHEKYPEMREQWLPCEVIWYQNPGPADIASTFPVKTMEDLKGKKIQASPKMEVLAWEALGMVPVPLMVTETYHALETGVVDASSGDFNQFYLWKLYEVTKYRTGNTIGTMRGFPTLMRIESYNKLPDDIKQEFDRLTDPMAYTKRNDEGWEKFNAETTLEIQEYDKTVGNPPFYFLPDAERERWKEVIWPLVEGWADEMEAEGMPGKAILEDAIAFAAQYE
jgi:TRAP-type C4-dicarboxylate transport system substrate-binding protein